MSQFDLPWRLSKDIEQSVRRGLDHFEKAGQATWTKLQRGLVDAATTAVNAVAMSGATGSGISPAAAAFSPVVAEDVGEAVGAEQAFSPEAREVEDSLGTGASLVTDVLAGAPTAFMGGAGAVADATTAQAEAQRSGSGPLGQAATALLSAAPFIGAGTARKLVGGGTKAEALNEFSSLLDEASIKTPVADGPAASILDFDVPDQKKQLRFSQRPTEFFNYHAPTHPPLSKTRNEGIRWSEEQLKTVPEKVDAGDISRFEKGLEADLAPPVDLSDFSHKDLAADAFRPGVLEGLRADPEFAATGVPAMGKSSSKQHITVSLSKPKDPSPGWIEKHGVSGPDGKPYLVDGSHRLQVARELGLTELPGIVKNEAGEEIYRGLIPIAKKKP